MKSSIPPQANLLLIGLMGSGKTSVGRRLARALQRRFIDLDLEIVRTAGMPIPRIFEQGGETLFRTLETDALGHIEPGRGLIVSCGGGVVISELNRRLLRELGIVVWLQATPEALAQRIEHSRNRPLLADKNVLDTLRQLAAERAVWYRDVAHVSVDTTGRDHDDVAAAVLSALQDDTAGADSTAQSA